MTKKRSEVSDGDDCVECQRYPTDSTVIVRCVACPFCHDIVDATLKKGIIYCPSCGASATYTKSAQSLT